MSDATTEPLDGGGACRLFGRDEAEENAALFALGALDRQQAARFARHLESGCEFCAGELARDLEVLAELAGTPPPVPPAPALWERLRARLRSVAAPPSVEGIQVWKRWREPSGASRESYILRDRPDDWERTACPGVHIKRLHVDTARRYVTMLVRMRPLSSYPGHLHAGTEECYVIEGDLAVGGEVLGPGDYQYAAAGSEHGVQSTEHGCLLLIVSSQDDELT
jgi:anti-sigma factor ChrR (cupin superfamily)